MKQGFILGVKFRAKKGIYTYCPPEYHVENYTVAISMLT